MPPAVAPLLSLRRLTIAFPTPDGPFEAVSDLSFEVAAGRTLAIVGESGSGKSVTSMALMRLLDYTPGRILSGQALFQAKDGPLDIVRASTSRLHRLRGNEISMIFQEPMTSLDPVFSVGAQIMEAIMLHQRLGAAPARRKAKEMLDAVRMPDAEQVLDRYPHQLSGGQRQRVMIAMALACQPQLLIADEPTTALDVTIQAQILNLIRDLQSRFGTAVIFITHDMGVVAQVADDVVVMRHGKKVEEGPVADVFNRPRHPYTQALLAAVPRLGALQGKPLPYRTPLVQLREDGTLETLGATRAQDTADYGAPLLQVRDLSTRFDVARDFLGRATHHVHAVEHVSFDLYPGETLALVGESGSGKTTVGKSIQQLVPASAGSILYQGQDIFRMDRARRQRLRQEIQYIFQDPYASLDPRKTVGFSIAEPIITHGLLRDKQEIDTRVRELLVHVGLQAGHAGRLPHEFSGGQRQRVCIARALACRPRLIIADESVSALDASTQAQILDLFMRLQEEHGLAYLFITHNMAVVEQISHRVAVMYLGQIVELGPRQAVFETPAHPYTRRLLSAVPVADPARRMDTPLATGDIPSVIHRVDDPPAIHPLADLGQGHWAAQQASPAPECPVPELH
ncbi:ABC transporter ATP-binding protein [uncultured Castellaniella sp.]|uniref:ABC transporter ATP-binding protein n=1 Tax=uncultured Castellaniella sp. TaxID=647907 RepID=UPI00260D3DD5|nr:ABC transporter ATP-binding protein [uncultured Castellaniella sp.]